MRATSSRRSPRRPACRRAATIAGRRDFPEALRHAGRQRDRLGLATCRATSPPDPKTGLSADVTPFWMIGGTGVEVEVDTETGHVRITQARQRRRLPARRSIRASARRSFPAAPSCSSASRCSRTWCSTAARSPMRRSPTTRFPGFHDVPPMESALVAAEQSQRPVRRQGHRRVRHLRRVAGDRQRHRGRGRGAALPPAADRRGGAARAAGESRAGRWRNELVGRGCETNSMRSRFQIRLAAARRLKENLPNKLITCRWTGAAVREQRAVSA